jgi:glycosyltransferase involved in cell wall biosynthesis
MTLHYPKRIALVTNWYPPKTGVAVNRMKAFARYLSEDFEIHVFCEGAENKIEVVNERLIVHYFESKNFLDKLKSNPKDGKLLHNGKTLLRIVASKIWTDPLKKWKENTLKGLKKEHSKKPFQLVISSFSPKEPHEIVLLFKTEFPEVKWIADMRDEMYLNQNIHGKQKVVLQKLEEKISKKVDAILSVSLPIVDAFEENYPNIQYFEEIRNGFDFDRKEEKHVSTKSADTIKIGYFGTFYGGRKPEQFFTALLNVQDNYPKLKIEVHLVGTHKNFEIPSKLHDNVIMHAPKPYLDAIDYMKTMDANLLVEPISVRKGIFTGKIFDYLAVQKPIIAIVDSTDVAADLTKEFNAGYVASFDNPKEQISILKSFIDDWSDGKVKAATDSQIDTLHRKESVNKLGLLIHKMIEQ